MADGCTLALPLDNLTTLRPSEEGRAVPLYPEAMGQCSLHYAGGSYSLPLLLILVLLLGLKPFQFLREVLSVRLRLRLSLVEALRLV